MRKITLLLILSFQFSIFNSFCQSYSGPESVVYDSANNRYLISNNGANQILARDASGVLSIFTSNISSGPHGLEVVGNTLFACDGAYMKGFDLTTAALVMNLNTGATFLNGICTDGVNYIFATDFTAKKIFKIDIAAQTYTVFATGLAKSPNGIIYDAAGGRIIWVTWGSNAPIMQALLADSSVSQVTATTLGNCDGIVRDGAGNYFVSAWNTQSIYRFDNAFASAPVQVITGLSSPADIYYNLNDDSLVSPNAGNNTVTFHYMGSTTGMDEINAEEISVFPNPAVNELRIKNDELRIGSIEIFSTLGEKRLTLPFDFAQGGRPVERSRSVSIDVSSLGTGIYFVRVNSGDRIFTAKFIKE
jgi:hypothetical protein